MIDLTGLPMGETIREGLDELSGGRTGVAAFLVAIASHRLRRCGIEVPISDRVALEADHRLYALLVDEYGEEAYGRYNALLRELVSFERALEGRHRRLTAA